MKRISLSTMLFITALAFVGLATCLRPVSGAEPTAAVASESPSTQAAHVELPPKVGQKAPDFALNTLDQQVVRLSEQRAKGPVVLIVLRGWPGYQCPFCTRQVGQFLSRAADFKAANARVVVVYPGPADRLADHATEFISGKSFPAGFSLVIDPDLKFTESYGLRWNAPKETAYPSTFVIDQQGIIRFAKMSKTHGDRASAAAVLKALGEIKQ